jgi:zinc finger RNA-binding protein
MYNNYGGGAATNYSAAYGSFPSSTNNASTYSQQVQAINSAYGNYQYANTAARGYPQPPTAPTATTLGYSAYDYTNAYKAQSAENPYGVGTGRSMPTAPVGFQSAGTLSSVNASGALGAYAAQTAAQSATPGVASGTHYDGYDAAVLAAATSYIASKSSGLSNNWLNMKTPRAHPDATFPSKKRAGLGHRHVPKDTQTFFCDICKISCAGNNTYQEHLKGKNHKKKEAMVTGKNQISLPKNKVSFRCDICDVTCSGRDTYDAHAKGTRHQKTLALLRKMGKPLPSTEPVIIAPEGSVNSIPPSQIPIVGADSTIQPPQKTIVVGVTATRFVGGTNLATADADKTAAEKDAVEAALEAEANIHPVGEEFVDSKFDPKGKLLEYHCRLCDCSFSDPNAKAVHTKGRRHRLAYKAKVDPKLKVEMKGSTISARHKKNDRVRNSPASAMAPQPLFANNISSAHQWANMDNSMFSTNHESPDDKHVIKKYNEIRMDDARLEGVNRLVDAVETALKSVSDKITEADFKEPIKSEPPTEGKKEETKEEETKGEGDQKNDEEKLAAKEQEKKEEAPPKPERVLRGLMKVGLLANGILMNDDQEVDLVVISSVIPTKRVLDKIVQLLPETFDVAYKEKLTITPVYEAARFLVEVGGFDIQVRITLTCPTMREYEGKGNETRAAKELSKDTLPLAPCLAALAELRRAKWYQAKAVPIEGMNMSMVVLRDIRQRVNTWEPLTSWILSMLVQHVLESFGYTMTPGDALRRVFEAISSGVFLCKRGILYDPCEKEKVDIMECLTPQQREDITSSAQHALRLIIFDQIHKILDMDKIENSTESKANIRKRPFENDENSPKGEEVELKKYALKKESSTE